MLESKINEKDLIIFYKKEPKHLLKDYVVIGGKDKFSKVDIPKTSKKLPLLLARLAYVFEIYDEKYKDDENFEDFVEIVLKSVRVKKEILNHSTSLEEVAGVLYLMDNAKKIGVFVGEVDEEELESLMSFLKMFESKVEVFFDKPKEIDLEFYGI